MGSIITWNLEIKRCQCHTTSNGKARLWTQTIYLWNLVLKSFYYNVYSHLPVCNNGNKGESCHFSTAIEYIMATNRRKRLKTGIFLGKKKGSFPWFLQWSAWYVFSHSSELVSEHTCVPVSADFERETICLHLINNTKRGEWRALVFQEEFLQSRGQELLSQIIADLWSTGIWPKTHSDHGRTPNH